MIINVFEIILPYIFLHIVVIQYCIDYDKKIEDSLCLSEIVQKILIIQWCFNIELLIIYHVGCLWIWILWK